jgi:hypothetical protein
VVISRRAKEVARNLQAKARPSILPVPYTFTPVPGARSGALGVSVTAALQASDRIAALLRLHR